MTINQPSPPIMPVGLPDLQQLNERAEQTGGVLVYQPYLDAGQLQGIDPLALAFDISFNTQSGTREYELFRILDQHHAAVDLPENMFWGLVSSKFELKSVSTLTSFISEAELALKSGADAYLYNPLIGHAAIYSNVWEHAMMGGHPGMNPIFQYLQNKGYPIAAPQGRTSFFFCNYFVANRRFWQGYFAFCEHVLDSLEREAELGTPVGKAYSGNANYSRDADAAMRPFVIERLLGLYIPHAVASGMTVSAFVPSAEDFEWRFGGRVGRYLHSLFECKEEFLQSKDKAYLEAWQETRMPIVKQPQLIWHGDDPPTWMPRMHREASPQGIGSACSRGDKSLPPPYAAALTAMKQPVAPVPAAPAIPAPVDPRLIPFVGGWEAHKNRHCIWIVTPPGYTHSQAFDEVAQGLQGAFEELGGSAPIIRQVGEFAGRSPIIYGANLLTSEVASRMPKGSVIMNLEQVSADSTWINERYTAVLKTLPVLDYSQRNRENLAGKGITHARVLEVGYSKRLTRIPQNHEKDIDVLFYGSMNDRRRDILVALRDEGLNVKPLFNVYGQERDEAIARAKVVINIHHYESAVFEIVRISYLLANGVCVLSEGNIHDPDLSSFKEGVAIERYDGLVERCKALIADAEGRSIIANRGFEAISSRLQADMLMKVMQQA
ncbi:glycosyltransferase family 1 protein [Agrobacterium larrymoorei]|uniref:glycosyltransferase family 1 protein n=1 Tax=Agrobacterium larrymoorei TaxID=160699 RepID=UPI00157482A1|nr:glycosyltransferase family 1 protein [Agrobacterium larrymoorei]NTJ43605.1 glycosyltransferase family 1 protein [Agrobacterium larrymoorei]